MQTLYLLERIDENGASTHDMETIFVSEHSAKQIGLIIDGKTQWKIRETFVLDGNYIDKCLKNRLFILDDFVISRDKFDNYERMRKNGKYNVFDPKFALAVGLSMEQLKYLFEFYTQLKFSYLIQEIYHEKTDEIIALEVELEQLSEELRETQNTLQEIRKFRKK